MQSALSMFFGHSVDWRDHVCVEYFLFLCETSEKALSKQILSFYLFVFISYSFCTKQTKQNTCTSTLPDDKQAGVYVMSAIIAIAVCLLAT